MRLIYVFLALIFLFTGCKGREITNNTDILAVLEENINTNDEKQDDFEISDPFRILAAEIASLMDDKLLASQVIISGIDGNNKIPPHMERLLTQVPAGGIMLFRSNLNTNNDTIRSFLTDVSRFVNEKSGIPPFIAVDHEGGIVNRFINGVASLPSASSYWQVYQQEGWNYALEKIEKDSFRAGSEIYSLGVNMNFAPIAEYLIEENRVFLQYRSYGPSPFFTAHAAAAFVRGMDNAGVLCVIKHFPGSAGSDPHYFPSVFDMDMADLRLLVSPFTALINRGVRAVMAAHTYVPQIDDVIASLSPFVMQNWLRGELGFDGIIISDDFNMAAAGSLSPQQAAVNSIIAGTDMILVWQHQLLITYNAVIAALNEGRLPRERLVDAASKIIYEKLRMGLMKAP